VTTTFEVREHGKYVQAIWRFSIDGLKELQASVQPFPGGDFAEIVFYRTYSRDDDDQRESWLDVVVRVIEGMMSIRLDWYVRAGQKWDEPEMQIVALLMAKSLMEFKWCPPGRGLFAMGTKWVRDRGSMALFNCGASEIRADENLPHDLAWITDALMCGVGVGCGISLGKRVVAEPVARAYRYEWVIPDTREGWVESISRLVQAEMGVLAAHPIFDYSEIRPKGSPLRGMGGRASGSDPLLQCHEWIRDSFGYYRRDLGFNTTRLLADLVNQIGAAVSMGDVRRSAEILLGDPDDETFWDLKNYDLHPERAEWGWASNNTLRFHTRAKFLQCVGRLADGAFERAEPGALLLFNSVDKAKLVNPCGEILLDHRELCNVVETFPGRCADEEDMIAAAEHAAFYAGTVALLPTHRHFTNEVLGRNRRIGVSLVGTADWQDRVGESELRRILRRAYRRVRATTASFMLRRIRIGRDDPIRQVLECAGYFGVEDKQGAKDVLVYEVPVRTRGRTAKDSSFQEQADLLACTQEVWSDNAVSCTLYFTEHEYCSGQVERTLVDLADRGVKSLALGLEFDPATSAYELCPEEEITEKEYHVRTLATVPLDWTGFRGEVTPPRGCDGEKCSV